MSLNIDIDKRYEGAFSEYVSNVNTSLRYDAWKQYDQMVMEEARPRLVGVGDLVSAGLSVNYDLGVQLALYEKTGGMTPSNISMDGVVPSNKDNVEYASTGVPIPVFRKDFSLTKRNILAGQRNGQPTLSSEHIKQATRTVADDMENMIFNGISLEYAGLKVQGYTNFQGRNTYTIPISWTNPSATPLKDVLNMVQEAKDDYYDGPFTLYVPRQYSSVLSDDFSAAKGSDTLKDRLEKIPSIKEVKEAPMLADDNLVLVQLTSNVVDLPVAQNIIPLEQPQTDNMQFNFMVYSALAIRIKTDIKGNIGLVHGSL